MIIESGVIVALGLLMMFYKCGWKQRMFMLSNPLLFDLGVFVLLNFLHWGTFSGMMVAAVGSLVCSALISIGRKAYGYQVKGKYVPGIWDVRTFPQ